MRWNGCAHTFTFPSGATLQFGHIQHEDSVINYQGGSWDFIGMDETTQFSPRMIAYPKSRIRRSVECLVPSRWRGASNPGGVGHDFIKKRFVANVDGASPCGPDLQFFPATIADNPHLNQSEYIANLRESGIDPLTLEQLLHGDWNAVMGGRFKASWLRHYHKEPGTGWLRFGGDKLYTLSDIRNRFLTVDPAATSVQLAKDDPDYTAVSAWGQTPCKLLVWLGCRIVRCEIPEIPEHVWQEYKRYSAGRAFVEGFGIGKGPAQLCRRHPGAMNVVEYTPQGDGKSRDKLANAANALNMAEAGRLWLPLDNPAFPRDEVESQLLTFTGSAKLDAHDDIVDSLSKAANVICGGARAQPHARHGIMTAREGRRV
jgi:phage terminase large subunit-like protein